MGHLPHPSARRMGLARRWARTTSVRSNAATWRGRSRPVAGRGRFLDKTPRNVLRLPYLDALFPDAHYVFIRRDPRGADRARSSGVGATSASAAGRCRSPSRCKGYPSVAGSTSWCRVGATWMAGRVEDVCAHQFMACDGAVQSFTAQLDADRWSELRYEDLLDDPVDQAERIGRELGVALPATSRDTIRGIVRTDDPDSWRTRTPDEIDASCPSSSPPWNGWATGPDVDHAAGLHSMITMVPFPPAMDVRPDPLIEVRPSRFPP